MEQGNAINFHGHIAWPLEAMAKRLLIKDDFRRMPSRQETLRR